MVDAPHSAAQPPLGGVAAPRILPVVQGTFEISRDQTVVLSTILGSCVAVCLFDLEIGVGGMNHFLLPSGGDGDTKNIKYGAHSMELLINRMFKSGARRGALKAKVFGGASMNANLRDIGGSNAAFAKGFLRDEGIPTMSESLGGMQARRVHFHPVSGAARMMMVPQHEAPVERIERVRAPAVKTDIELF